MKANRQRIWQLIFVLTLAALVSRVDAANLKRPGSKRFSVVVWILAGTVAAPNVQSSPPGSSATNTAGASPAANANPKGGSLPEPVTIKDVVTIVGVFFGVLGGLVAFLSFRENWKRNFREAIFKCNEGYLKVMECKSKALAATTKEKQQTFNDYFRMLFDLQWTEFQLWHTGTLPTEQYREWLRQRKRDFDAPAVTIQTEAGNLSISYSIVWNELLAQHYYDPSDPFILHMKKVHEGKIDEVLKDRDDGILPTLRRLLK